MAPKGFHWSEAGRTWQRCEPAISCGGFDVPSGSRQWLFLTRMCSCFSCLSQLQRQDAQRGEDTTEECARRLAGLDGNQLLHKLISSFLLPGFIVRLVVVCLCLASPFAGFRYLFLVRGRAQVLKSIPTDTTQPRVIEVCERSRVRDSQMIIGSERERSHFQKKRDGRVSY